MGLKEDVADPKPLLSGKRHGTKNGLATDLETAREYAWTEHSASQVIADGDAWVTSEEKSDRAGDRGEGRKRKRNQMLT